MLDPSNPSDHIAPCPERVVNVSIETTSAALEMAHVFVEFEGNVSGLTTKSRRLQREC